MKKNSQNKGFTLIELLVVIAIIGMLASLGVVQVKRSKDKAYFAKTQQQLRALQQALYLYLEDHDNIYPVDAIRKVPVDIINYLQPGEWPPGAWPESVWDWDNWLPPPALDLAYEPKEHVVQFSIRFCEYGDPTDCNYPNEEWAKDFDYFSSVYWCIEGPCRSHGSQPVNHPGYCMNCK